MWAEHSSMSGEQVGENRQQLPTCLPPYDLMYTLNEKGKWDTFKTFQEKTLKNGALMFIYFMHTHPNIPTTIVGIRIWPSGAGQLTTWPIPEVSALSDSSTSHGSGPCSRTQSNLEPYIAFQESLHKVVTRIK